MPGTWEQAVFYYEEPANKSINNKLWPMWDNSFTPAILQMAIRPSKELHFVSFKGYPLQIKTSSQNLEMLL